MLVPLSDKVDEVVEVLEDVGGDTVEVVAEYVVDMLSDVVVWELVLHEANVRVNPEDNDMKDVRNIGGAGSGGDGRRAAQSPNQLVTRQAAPISPSTDLAVDDADDKPLSLGAVADAELVEEPLWTMISI